MTVQDSATLSIPGTLNLYNGASSGNSTEVLNLNGGTTTVGNFLASSGSSGVHQSRINFNGGILKAATNDAAIGATFLPALAGLIVDVTNTLPVIFVNTNGFTNTIAAVLANTTANPDGGLTKRGGGTLILSTNNTYNGPTTVSKGTLLVNGSIGTGAVNILTNGTLGGSGTIGGEVTNATGTLAPGAGSGGVAGTTLTNNSDVTLLSGSTNIMEVSVNNNTHDTLIVSGTLTYGGILSILTNTTDTTPLDVGTHFTLFTATTFAGSFSSIQPAPGPGLAWSNSLSIDGSIEVVSNTVVVTPPAAGFSGTPTNIFVTQSVSLTDASTGSITNWVWNFGDGVSVTNNSNVGVNHAYNAAGSYTVSLSVSGAGGSSSTRRQLHHGQAEGGDRQAGAERRAVDPERDQRTCGPDVSDLECDERGVAGDQLDAGVYERVCQRRELHLHERAADEQGDVLQARLAVS